MDDPFWDTTPKGTHLRHDGLKMWSCEGEWRFRTVDSAVGRVNKEDSFDAQLGLSAEEARAWIDFEIPFEVARIRLLMCS